MTRVPHSIPKREVTATPARTAAHHGQLSGDEARMAVTTPPIPAT